MRICRFQRPGDTPQTGFYTETGILPLAVATDHYHQQSGQSIDMPSNSDLLLLLPPDGPAAPLMRQLRDSWGGQTPPTKLLVPITEVELLVPIPRPNKLFLLAGNYASHIEEGGDVAAEQSETFPYVFMKPPSTTLTHPGQAIRIPRVSPSHVDWELELAVVIGRGGKGISESSALDHVAGYTIINDISDRKFRPNPARKERDRDRFFDWMHGKWHDSFCPCGPCIATPESIPDPQALKLTLAVNQTVRQDAGTHQQIFPVAAVIAFLSSFVTLEPGDIISTGTPAGVGSTTQTFLQPGDTIEASISGIGTLTTPVIAE